MTTTTTKKPTLSIARKVLATVDKGLCSGLGNPKPGEMCIEAAVCYAYGLPHGDNPPCVSPALRQFKITLNDKPWSSNKARALGLRRLGIAQLGSNGMDDKVFAAKLAEKFIRVFVTQALRSAAGANPKHAEKLEACAKACESTGTRDAALDGRKAASVADAANAAYAAADAAYAAYAAANAAYAAANVADAADAAYAAASVAYAAANAAYAAYAAASVAYAAANVADAAWQQAYAARQQAYAAYAAASVAYAAYAAANRDRTYTLAAECCIEVLRELNQPGIALMDKLCPLPKKAKVTK